MNLFDEIRQAEMQVHELRERLLDKLGWTFSSAYPDHFWRWSKTFGDRTMTLNAKEAVELEERIAPNRYKSVDSFRNRRKPVNNSAKIA